MEYVQASQRTSRALFWGAFTGRVHQFRLSVDLSDLHADEKRCTGPGEILCACINVPIWYRCSVGRYVGCPAEQHLNRSPEMFMSFDAGLCTVFSCRTRMLSSPVIATHHIGSRAIRLAQGRQ